MQLHGFCNASESAYARVVYLRAVDQDGLVHMSQRLALALKLAFKLTLKSGAQTGAQTGPHTSNRVNDERDVQVPDRQGRSLNH